MFDTTSKIDYIQPVKGLRMAPSCIKLAMVVKSHTLRRIAFWMAAVLPEDLNFDIDVANTIGDALGPSAPAVSWR